MHIRNQTLMRRTASDTVEIGQKLISKQQLGHGNFHELVKAEFNWSVSAATIHAE